MATISIPYEQPVAVTRADAAQEPEGPPGTEPSLMSMVDELLALAGGIGFVFVAFLAAIPGLVPFILLAVAFGAVLAIPVIALGLVGAVVGGIAWLLTRAVRLVSRRVD